MNIILATDCGSTTTKAILIEKKGDIFRQTFRGEAPTTVEAPFEDVTKGVLNAIQEIEELSGRVLLDDKGIIIPSCGNRGCDLYVSTSSAGGGLQMMVAGAVKTMTAESAERCALGAGAIVMDVLASNDGKSGFEKIELLRHLRPDMILLSGGTDGGTISHVIELANYIKASDLMPRFGSNFDLPVIYAGNKDARKDIEEILKDKTAIYMTENIRPVLEVENLGPAREKIHDLFLSHVMAQAPGYPKLMSWTGAPVMPTPAAVGMIMQKIAEENNINLLGVDIGGATTDVFSVFNSHFNRTVSANLGMSYSISNVVVEAGLDNIVRWLNFQIAEEDLRDRIKNKMIRPTTIPQDIKELIIEHAIAREALRLAFEHHRMLAVELKGIQQKRTISDVFSQNKTGQSLIRIENLNLIVGSGGILSHAPRRIQAMVMMVDAFQPYGITELAVDSIFMMPHLGVILQVNPKASLDVFKNDCLIPLGTCIAPYGSGKYGDRCFDYKINYSDGSSCNGSISYGQLMLIEAIGVKGNRGIEAVIEVRPTKFYDFGNGYGKEMKREIREGVCGILLDSRGRPITIPPSEAERIQIIQEWIRGCNLYPAF